MRCADSKEKFVKDFVAAWTKVMNADRFDLRRTKPRLRRRRKLIAAARDERKGRPGTWPRPLFVCEASVTYCDGVLRRYSPPFSLVAASQRIRAAASR